MSNNQRTDKTRFYFWTKPSFVIIMIFVLPPLGIYLLYKHNALMPKGLKLTLSIFGVTAWLIVLLSAMLSPYSEDASTSATDKSDTSAVTAPAEPETDWIGFMENAKSNIKKGLKSPSTAEFPGSLFDPYDGWKRDKIGDTINLESYVDSQNSYGAKVRSYFTIKYNNLDDTKYHPFYIELDGNVLKNDS